MHTLNALLRNVDTSSEQKNEKKIESSTKICFQNDCVCSTAKLQHKLTNTTIYACTKLISIFSQCEKNDKISLYISRRTASVTVL